MADYDELYKEIFGDQAAEDDEEEVELQVFNIEYADGTSAECGILAQFEVEFEETDATQEYVAVVELEDGELPEDGMEVMLFRYFKSPMHPDQFRLEDIDDDDEREIVQNVFEQIMNDEDEEQN